MAESGRQRAVLFNRTRTDQNQSNEAQWWTNTADELTSINLTFTAGITGRAVLYKRASTESRLVSREAIDGDFSAGKTWSGLLGDTDGMYEIICNTVDKGADAGYLQMTLNGDTGSNYEYQILRGYGATANAATGTVSGVNLDQHYGQISSFAKLILFPVSGKYRPILLELSYKNSVGDLTIALIPYWWHNTADEITSIKIANSVTTAIKGFIQLKKIALPS